MTETTRLPGRSITENSSGALVGWDGYIRLVEAWLANIGHHRDTDGCTCERHDVSDLDLRQYLPGLKAQRNKNVDGIITVGLETTGT